VSVASGLVRKLPRQARWAVPAGAVAAVGIVIAGSALAGAQAAPQLPARTTAQLIAAVDAPSALPSAMTAVVQETASLGLPNLPGSSASDPLSGLSLLSGSHTFKIWYDGPTRVRIAIPVTLGETDLRRDGRNVWLWDSQTSQATHYVLPASASEPAQVTPEQTAPTPQQVARQILAAVGQTTTVGLQSNVMVAGHAAYQLSLAPKDSRSLVGQVRIAIDARNSLPLRVQVFARGASSPAFQVAYTSLSFARPATSNFPFTPPPGAKVKTITVPAGGGFAPGLPSLGAGQVVPGKSMQMEVLPATGKVVLPKALPAAVRKRLVASLLQQLPASLTKAQRAKALQSLENGLASPPGAHAWIAVTPLSGGQVPVVAGSAGPPVMGQGWLSVVVLPAGGIPSAGLPPGAVAYGSTGSVNSGSGTFSSSAASPGPGIDASGLSGALLSAARPVHGSWGSGRLLRTSLISVLITSDGQVLIGAVQPSVLYADAAQLR